MDHDARMARFEKTDLYVVITESFCGGRSALEVLDAVLDAGVRLVQFREKDLEFLRKLFITRAKSIVAMSYGNPFLIRKIGEVPAFLVGFAERGWYGNQEAYFDSFIKLIKGDLAPQGKLPVEVSDRYPLGFGLSY